MDRLDNALKFCADLKTKRESLPEVLDKTIYILKCNKYYKIGYASNLYERHKQYIVHNP